MSASRAWLTSSNGAVAHGEGITLDPSASGHLWGKTPNRVNLHVRQRVTSHDTPVPGTSLRVSGVCRVPGRAEGSPGQPVAGRVVKCGQFSVPVRFLRSGTTLSSVAILDIFTAMARSRSEMTC